MGILEQAEWRVQGEREEARLAAHPEQAALMVLEGPDQWAGFRVPAAFSRAEDSRLTVAVLPQVVFVQLAVRPTLEGVSALEGRQPPGEP